MIDIRPIENQVNYGKALLVTKQSAMKDLKSQKIRCEKMLQDLRDAQSILQTLATTVQKRFHERLCELVSNCLTRVFGTPYQFTVRFTPSRGTTEAKMLFIRGGVEVDPMEAAGGGVVDVAAFALRIAVILLHPNNRRLLVLDEPFRFVNSRHFPKLKQLIQELSEQMDFQFVFITHIEELKNIPTAHHIEIGS